MTQQFIINLTKAYTQYGRSTIQVDQRGQQQPELAHRSPARPVVYEDFLLFEKTAHFNRERIPEGVVHANGSAAHGHLVCTNPDMAKWTSAKLFEKWERRRL